LGNSREVSQKGEIRGEIWQCAQGLFPLSEATFSFHQLYHCIADITTVGLLRDHWMFKFERFNKTLEGFIKNKAQPFASIIKNYLAGWNSMAASLAKGCVYPNEAIDFNKLKDIFVERDPGDASFQLFIGQRGSKAVRL
jgi:hypothetical protein